MKTEELRSRVRAAFLLVAIGDALGMPVELFTPENIVKRFGRITTYVDPPEDHKWHARKLKKGMWTDDKQLELIIEKSLIKNKGINLDDIAQGHVAALQESTSGWGGSTTEAVKKIHAGTHWSQSGIPDAAGNGISMKIAPVGVLMAIEYLYLTEKYSSPEKAQSLFFKYQGQLTSDIIEIARMTHQSKMAIASGLAQSHALFACMTFPNRKFEADFLAAVINACKLGENMRYTDNVKDKLFERMADLYETTMGRDTMSIEELTEKYGGEGKARFYVLNSLSLSYALFLRNPYSMETLFDTVNAGGDTDTNASMVGALLGARNGMKIFDGYEYLIDGLWRKDEIIETAELFCDTFIIE